MKLINSIGEKPTHSYEDGRTSEGQMHYDPDLAHPAAGYRDAEAVELPAGVSERKLLTKIDFRVIPVLSILYLLAFLDRTNVANANVFGLSEELNLKGVEYNTALTYVVTSHSHCLN